MFKPSSRLQHWYDKYNKLYFDGELDTEAEVGWNDELPEDTLGQTLAFTEAEGNHSYFRISISTQLLPFVEITKQTVLHEMVHIKLHPYMKHGKRFNSEMLALAAKGAFNGLW